MGDAKWSNQILKFKIRKGPEEGEEEEGRRKEEGGRRVNFLYKVVGVVKWHWESEAWQRQTSVRKRLALVKVPGDEAEEPEEAEKGDTDGSPESSTSSSSFSSIESRWKGMTISLLLVVDVSGRVAGDPGGFKSHVQRWGLGGFNWCSKSSNWPIKLKLGEMLAFLRRTKSYASFRLIDILYIRYATVIVTEREIPAKQCTRTPSPRSRAPSVNHNQTKRITTPKPKGGETLKPKLKSSISLIMSKYIRGFGRDFNWSILAIQRQY